MKSIQPWLPLALLLALLAGCSNDDQMSQEEVEFLSHMDQAQFFREQGELQASTQEARNAMELKPDQFEPWFLVIRNLITAGDGDTAERQLDELAERIDTEDPENRDHLNRMALARAQARLIREDWDGAIEALDSLREPERNQQITAHRLAGDAHRQAGDADAARKAYKRALDTNPGAIMAHLGFSRLAWQQGDKEAAREHLAAAREQDADDSEVWLWRARIAHQEGRFEEAAEAYTQALEGIGRYDVMTRRKYETISLLIDVLRENGNASQAFVYEEMLANSAPGTIRSGMRAAREAYGEGNLSIAAGHLEEVLAQAPGHDDAGILLGIIRFQQGRMDDAESLLSEYQDKVDSGELTKMLAAARIQLQRPEEARRMLEELDPEGNDPGVVALIGVAALSSGEDQLGRAMIEQSLAMAPDNTDLRVRFARYLASEGNNQEARTQLETAIERAPDAEQPRAFLARFLAEQGEHEAARKVVDQWRGDQPDSVLAQNLAGDIAQLRGDSDAARQHYQEAIGMDESPASHHALGALHARDGNAKPALEHLRRAVELAPDSPRYLRDLVSVAANHDAEDATRDFLARVADESDSATAPHRYLLQVALESGDDERASELVAAIENRLDDSGQKVSVIAGAYLAAARTTADRGNDGRTRELVRQGRQRYTEHEGLALFEARLQFEAERASDARDILRSIKTQHPGSPRPFLLEADYMASEGNYSQAADLYQLARDKSDSPQTVARQVRVLREAERGRRAIEVLEAATEKFPQSSRLYLELAMLEQSTGNREAARSAYERTLQLAPENAVALNNLAWLLHEDEPERALELAEKAYNANPEAASIVDTYGWILFRNGDLERSIEILESAHELAPEAAEIREHLAAVHREAGNNARAEELTR
ncbi:MULTISPECIES: tetratricopeptide repeat protein [Halomonadaceae]|uniref:Tetratricopeptide repeat protein n=1 Tax=Vreelandella halophila TaxID=86177 RepID=A0A9X5B5Q8_9GAMM|nr:MULTISPECIES: tetratricopeptide repeat protein [Halomonas]MYL26743.1 tetratricopeptide repeat protein [Halomonas utahensis]MYL75560.1 tetratricopeptide repeat protein [Halomonas sp. 22501_18_FS]